MGRVKRILRSLWLYIRGKKIESRLLMLMEDDEVLVRVYGEDRTVKTRIGKVEGNLEEALKKGGQAFIIVSGTRYLVTSKPDKDGYFHVYVKHSLGRKKV